MIFCCLLLGLTLTDFFTGFGWVYSRLRLEFDDLAIARVWAW